MCRNTVNVPARARWEPTASAEGIALLNADAVLTQLRADCVCQEASGIAFCNTVFLPGKLQVRGGGYLGSKRDSSATEVRPGFCSMVRLDRFLDRQGRFFSSCKIASSPDSGEDLIEDYPDETNTLRTRPRSKYGLCRKHRCARRPHIFEHGSNAGKPVHICGLFFKRSDNQRMCWHFEIVHRRVVQDLWPEQMRAKYANLSGSVDKGGR